MGLNNMKSRILYSAMLVFLPLVVLAQESAIDRNVTVEREYQPVIEDAGKITTIPSVLDPATSKQRVDYSDFYHPLPMGRYLQRLPMSDYEPEKVKRQEAFIRLGMGNYFNTMGDVMFPLLKKDKDRLDININHTGTFGRRKFSETTAGIDYNHFFKTTELFASLEGTHRFFNYFGSNFSMTGDRFAADSITGMIEKDTHTGLQASLGFRSLPGNAGFRHQGSLAYENLITGKGWKEQLVNARYGFSNLLKENRYGVDFDLKNMNYDAPAGLTEAFPDYSVLALNPYYLIEREKASLRVGLTTSFSFVTGRTFNPAPDISAEWKLLPRFMALYGGVGGGFNTVTYSNLLKENPWIMPSLRVKDTYTPFKPYLGVKIKPFHFLLLDGFVEYNSIKDQYFFVNDSVPNSGQPYLSNQFDVEYSDASLFRAGARINFQYKNVISSSFKIISNSWNVETQAQAWMKPGLEADWNLDVKVNPNLTVSSNFFYEGKRFARLGSQVVEMKPVTDLNLSASYFFNRTFSSFLKLNNILNRSYEQYLGYDVQGFNFLLGGAVSF